MALRTAFSLSGETLALPLITRETVAGLTPAVFATKSKVASTRLGFTVPLVVINQESSDWVGRSQPVSICKEPIKAMALAPLIWR